MKKIVTLVILLSIALLAARLIPVSQKKEIVIKNTLEHVINNVNYPKNWIKWHPDLKNACVANSECNIKEDTITKSFSFILPGKEITVTVMPALQYRVTDKKSADFLFSVSQAKEMQSTQVIYAQQSNLLYSVFPFLQKSDNADAVIKSLEFYLEDVQSFYGFNITTQPNEEKTFVVKRMITAKSQAFNILPGMFGDIAHFIQTKDDESIRNYNISYVPSKKDSTEIIAGIAIKKQVSGNDSIECMKIPNGQLLLVGNYEGVYAKKTALYSAMSLYMMDKRMPQTGAFFERFEPGKIPSSDSSIVKMQLCFPFYARQLSKVNGQ